jgi:hypothetical protein
MLATSNYPYKANVNANYDPIGAAYIHLGIPMLMSLILLD